MIQNFWYLNGAPSRMTLSYKYRTPILSGIQLTPVFRCYCSFYLVKLCQHFRVNFVDRGKISKDDFDLSLIKQLSSNQIRILQVLLEHVKDCLEDGRVVRLGLDELVEHLLPRGHASQVHFSDGL